MHAQKKPKELKSFLFYFVFRSRTTSCARRSTRSVSTSSGSKFRSAWSSSVSWSHLRTQWKCWERGTPYCECPNSCPHKMHLIMKWFLSFFLKTFFCVSKCYVISSHCDTLVYNKAVDSLTHDQTVAFTFLFLLRVYSGFE